MNENNDHKIEDRTKVYEMQYKTLVTTQKELDNLTKMRYRELIDDDTFVKERNELQGKITEMKEKLRHTENQAERWLELTEKTLNFATYTRSAFINGGLELNKKPATKAQTEALASIRAQWR